MFGHSVIQKESNMRQVREISSAEENFRMERKGPFEVPRRDPVKPEPEGTIVLLAFRVTGYDRDCDGSLMARLEHIDRKGESSGWEPSAIGLYPESELVVTQDEWQRMFEPKERSDGDVDRAQRGGV
jgi:hypothetical protein